MNLLNWIKKNAGFSLFAFNLALLVSMFLAYDPFGMIRTGYDGARPLLVANSQNTKEIKVISGDGSFLVLKKGEAVAPQSDKEKSIEKADKKKILYNWSLTRTRQGKPETISGDRDRVDELFASLEKARRYYAINRTPENERDAEMSRDSAGNLKCLQIVFTMQDGSTNTVYVGKSSLRGNESYIRLNEEDQLFLVEQNLRTSAGSGEPDFFRNRRVFPEIQRDQISELSANVGGKTIQLTRAGSEWQMITPVPGKANTSEMNSLLSEIIDWRAVSFPTNLPADLDKKKGMSVNISWKANMTDVSSLKFDVIGQKDFSAYVIRDSSGTLFEVNSAFLAHLFEPQEKLLEKGERK